MEQTEAVQEEETEKQDGDQEQERPEEGLNAAG